jgi:hypothetical protein
LVIGLARERAGKGREAQRQNLRVSSDVADVAKRPKKRPGRRERSSITTRWQAMLVGSITIWRLYSTWFEKRDMRLCNRCYCAQRSILRHSGMVRQHQTRNLEIPGSALRAARE